MKKLLNPDPDSGISQVFHYDPGTEMSTITTEQEIDPITYCNRFLSNEQGKRFAKSGITKVASIPLGVYYDLKRKGIVDDQVAFRRWMNDSDNRVFRTHEAVL